MYDGTSTICPRCTSHRYWGARRRCLLQLYRLSWWRSLGSSATSSCTKFVVVYIQKASWISEEVTARTPTAVVSLGGETWGGTINLPCRDATQNRRSNTNLELTSCLEYISVCLAKSEKLPVKSISSIPSLAVFRERCRSDDKKAERHPPLSQGPHENSSSVRATTYAPNTPANPSPTDMEADGCAWKKSPATNNSSSYPTGVSESQGDSNGHRSGRTTLWPLPSFSCVVRPGSHLLMARRGDRREIEVFTPVFTPNTFGKAPHKLDMRPIA